MPQQRVDIRMIKDILRLKYQGGLSHGRIARSLSISRAPLPSTSAQRVPPASTGRPRFRRIRSVGLGAPRITSRSTSTNRAERQSRPF